VFSEPTPGQGNSFYSGPQHVNSTFGCTDLSGALCSGGVSQGCHTVNVRAWDNMGLGSGDYTYGPVCYDTVAPHTTATLSGTSSGGTYTTAVKVTLTATDPSPGSGIASTVYQVNGGTVTTYTAPFTVSTAGAHTITFHSTDVAGNVEGTETANFSITSKTTTGLTASPNPSASGQFVTFTATVTPTFSGTPTGTVTFKNGTTNIGTSTLSGGVAKFSTKTLAVGSHSITAVYNGATYFTTSTSSAVTQVVENATTTTLVSSLNPAEFGQYVKFTATVTSTSSGTPTGTVTFKNGTTVLGTSNMSGGAASLFINTLAVNTHPITAVYSGNATFSTSTSAVLSQVINKAGSTTKVVSSANPSTVGETVTFTATVKSTTTGTPAGSVTFKDGTTTLGTRALSGGVATLAIKTLAAGTHSITAVYVGNFDYTTSTSAVLSQKVNAAASTTP
jgi:predicted secreted protein